MENASKALIIAGAILVSIMIIGLGVVILNNVRSTISNTKLTSEEAQANNEKFTSMFSQNAAASEVKNLITLVRSNNIVAENEKEGLGIIYLVFDGEEISPSQLSKTIKNGKRYRIDTPNDKSIKENEFLNPDNSSYTKNDSAYYYNGFLRAISIDTNSSNS